MERGILGGKKKEVKAEKKENKGEKVRASRQQEESKQAWREESREARK